MKIRLFYPAFDPLYAQEKQIDSRLRIAGTDLVFENGLLSGLVSERAALTDFDPETGSLCPGPDVLPPKPGNVMHRLSVTRAELQRSSKTVPAIQALCFGTVLRTVALVEKRRALGRKVNWGFDGQQLFVVPRAGYQANAFYHRDSHSLQFLLVADEGPPSAGENGEQLGKFTALSPDIVAHETAHAIIDGVAPYLYSAATPESLAIHEAVADLTALIVSLRTRNFVTHVLDTNDGKLDAKVIGSIAEEIGQLTRQHSSKKEHSHGLRNLANNLALPDSDGRVPERMKVILSNEPHDLSEVLSGALFSFLMESFDHSQETQRQKGVDTYSASGYSVAFAVDLMTAIVYRALDYLPPGEISFADFGRAMLAADKVFFPKDNESEVRDRLIKELEKRNIGDSKTLYSFENVDKPDLSNEDLKRFADNENDWQVYDFVNRYKNLFRIPDNTPFRVHEPLKLNKTIEREKPPSEIEEFESQAARHREAEMSEQALEDGDMDGDDNDKRVEVELTELLIKVSWKKTEKIMVGSRERTFSFLYGTTVSFDLETNEVLARLTTNSDGRYPDENVASQRRQHLSRQALISDWYAKGLISEGQDFDGSPQLVENNGIFELRNMMHHLHFAAEFHPGIPGWAMANGRVTK